MKRSLYVCPSCNDTSHANPGKRVVCTACRVVMIEKKDKSK